MGWMDLFAVQTPPFRVKWESLARQIRHRGRQGALWDSAEEVVVHRGMNALDNRHIPNCSCGLKHSSPVPRESDPCLTRIRNQANLLLCKNCREILF